MVTPHRFPCSPGTSPPLKLQRNSLRLRTLPITSFACSGLRAFPPMPLKIRNLGDGGEGGMPPSYNAPMKKDWTTKLIHSDVRVDRKSVV